MDILESIKKAAEAILGDKNLLEGFKLDPMKVVKSILGGEIDAGDLTKIVEGVTSQLAGAGVLGDLADAAKDAIGDAAGAATDAADKAKDAAEEAGDGIGGIIGKGIEALKKIF